MSKQNKISPTAWVVAMMRAEYTKIPYTAEIQKVISENRTPFLATFLYGLLKFFMQRRPHKMLAMTTLEGRYHSIESILPKNKEFVLLELGTGLSPRGLNHAEANRLVIESDMPEIIEFKEKIIDKVYQEKGKSGKKPDNHMFLSINVLSREDLLVAGEIYKKQGKNKPLYIVNEGLSMYFTKEENDIFRENLAWFFQKFAPGRGVWVSTDLTPIPSENTQKGPMGFMRKLLKRFTGRTFEVFETHEETCDFLAKSNFKGTPATNSDILKELNCLNKMGLTIEDVKHFSEQYIAYRVELA